MPGLLLKHLNDMTISKDSNLLAFIADSNGKTRYRSLAKVLVCARGKPHSAPVEARGALLQLGSKKTLYNKMFLMYYDASCTTITTMIMARPNIMVTLLI